MGWPWSKPKRRTTSLARKMRQARALKARFDAARTTPQNRRHWAGADSLSPDAAANPAVRATLRNRARYETANNCYAKGIVLTLANDLVGTGPRLAMLTGEPAINARIEREFARWAETIRLAEKLRTMRIARATDGEAFGLLVSNPRHGHSVTLDVRLVEADQIKTPNWIPSRRQPVDGIMYDAARNPAEYHLLTSHPGETLLGAAGGHRPVPARNVVHWYRADRPGQSRGIPDLAPALPLFALLRRYTLAVVNAAETAAEFALFVKTTMPAGGEAAGGQDDEGLGGLEMEIQRNMASFLPEGWEPAQVKAEQPPTTYPDFKAEIVSEIARALEIPRNIAALDSSRHNYASGRLDHQMYMRSILVDRKALATAVLDKVFGAWLAEAKRVPGLVPAGAWMEEDDPHSWYWPGMEEVDPRWARAKMDLVKAGLLSEAEYHAARGRDWEDELTQREREREARQERGLPQPETVQAAGEAYPEEMPRGQS